MRGDGTIEVVVARNATKEQAWGILPIPACPARGHEPGPTAASLAWSWGTEGRPVERGEAARALLDGHDRDRLARAVARVLAVEPLPADGLPTSPEVVALKSADRGEGIVVRLVDRHATGSVRVENPTSGVIQDEKPDGSMVLSLPEAFRAASPAKYSL